MRKKVSALWAAVGLVMAAGFLVGDRAQAVESGLVWSTFLGGSGSDDGWSLALDGAGNAVVAGSTSSVNFPTTAGAWDTSQNSRQDVFVTKLNAAGTALLYSTFLGGSDMDYGRSLALDSLGNAYVTGYTASSNFPTTGSGWGGDNSYNGGAYDVFVTKLNASGSALLYSTFLGGGNDDRAESLALDALGNAYVTGYTGSSNFPTTVGDWGGDSSYNGGSFDVFVTKLNAAGTALLYSTFLGGSSDDYGRSLALDSSGNVCVAGYTASSDFPTTAGDWGGDNSYNGGPYDAFVTKLSATGTALLYSTFLGGSSDDRACALALDGAGNAYVAGWTESSDFPTTGGAWDTSYNGGGDGFVTKLNATGSALLFSTFLGGSERDEGYSLTLDASWNAVLTGDTLSPSFPVTAGAWDTSFNGFWDVFVAKLNATGSALLYSTFLGGSSDDRGYSLALDGSGSVYVTGETWSGNFPATAGAWDTSFNGTGDAFVLKLAFEAPQTPTPTSTPTVTSTPLLTPTHTPTPTVPARLGPVWSSFLGGSGNDYGWSVALDGSGSAYVTGWTESSDFPATAGAWDTSQNGSWDVFVAKLNAAGTALLYSTFLGGSSDDYGRSLAVDGYGNACVTGYTGSTNFPTTGDWGGDDSYNGGTYDVFVTKLNASGSALLFSTFLGGSSDDYGRSLALDGYGNVYVTGYTGSNSFPTTPGEWDTSKNGSYDVFVTKLNASGTALLYSTFLGGSGEDRAESIALDGSGNACVAGYTRSSDFPTTPDAWDTSFNGGTHDVFVTKLSASGTTLLFSTFLGGSSYEYGYSVALDGSGNVCVTGATRSSDFPTTAGAWDASRNGLDDAFVTKLNSSGTALLYSTFLGGSSDDVGHSVALDGSGNAVLTGSTFSGDFPTTASAWDASQNGGYDVFVTALNASGTALLYSTLVGGSSTEEGWSLALDGYGTAFVTGYSWSSDFPTTAEAWDTSQNGAYDAFVFRFAFEAPPSPTVTSTPAPTPTRTPGNTIRVTSPNGGERWRHGTAHTISWSYTGNVGSYVKIELLRGTTVVRTLRPKVAVGSGGLGSWRWFISTQEAAGTNYRVRVTSLSNRTIKDLSNATFTIRE